jgi:thiosulfate/3-mercaptopyruvate sulfurtransferase
MLVRSAVTLLAVALLLPNRGEAAPRDRMLVSPVWLAAHLHDARLVLLHIGDSAEYAERHIPGARFLSLQAISERSANGLALELPPIGRLAAALADLGITSDSRIVLYFGDDWVSPTTRAWFTLDYAGLGDRTSILDGGLPAWQAAGYEVTAEPPPPVTPGRLALTPHPEVLATREWIKARIGHRRFRILDARDAEFYKGLDAGSGSRAGHLPGARSLPFGTVVDDHNRFLPDTTLRRLFQAAGTGRGDHLVAYCHVGQQATAVVFAARLLGFDVRLYDGSFQDWSRHEDLTVEGGVPPTRGALMTTDELARRLAAGDVTLIDLRSDLTAYLTNHIPGAVYLHYETLRASQAGTPGDILSPEAYAQLWSRLGVRRGRPVVIYGSGDAQNFNATFLAWLLGGFHHEEVFLLDGGYAKWVGESRPLSRLYPEVAAVPYPADTYLLDRIDGNDLNQMRRWSGMVLVDVRPPDQYTGAAGAQVRRGHIPGAINHFWHDDLTTAGGVTAWRPLEELRAAYTTQGITPDKHVVVYCNTGTEASHAYFALHYLLGYPTVRVYVPSWTEWAAHNDWPIDGPSATATATPSAGP